MQPRCIVIIELSFYNHVLYLKMSNNLIVFCKHHIDIGSAKLCVVVEECAALVVASYKLPVGALVRLNQVSIDVKPRVVVGYVCVNVYQEVHRTLEAGLGPERPGRLRRHSGRSKLR